MSAYLAQMGVALTFFHPVRDPNGAYVAAQAANVTQALLGPDRLASSEVAVLVDASVVGWVQVTITCLRLGEYTLSLTNPASADGRTTDYAIKVGAGVPVSATLLTSLDRVRTRLQLTYPAGQVGAPLIQPGQAHIYDSLINLLISEVSDDYQRLLGRQFAEATYTLYLDGTGRGSMVLPVGPLVSVTSLETVLYGDDGAGGVTETRTTVPRYSYVLSGVRAAPRFNGLGRIDLIAAGGYPATFLRGNKNYRCVCVAGFDTLPESLVGLATEDVVFRLMTRETGHLLSKSLGEGTISFLRPGQMRQERDVRLAPFILEAA